MELIDRIEKITTQISDSDKDNDFTGLEKCLDEALENFNEMSDYDKEIIKNYLTMAVARREVKGLIKFQRKTVRFMRRIKYPHLIKLIKLFKQINEGELG